jgi:putative oxidoreductase
LRILSTIGIGRQRSGRVRLRIDPPGRARFSGMPPSRSRRRSSEPGLASLVLRAALGGTFIAHGVRHGRTLDGTAGWFESIGFREPRLQAQVSSGVEIGAGAAVLAGAATPLSASAIVGTMAVAFRSVHQPNGYFITGEGWEYVGVLGAAAIALSALGAGPLSVDRALGIETTGTPSGRAALTTGLGLAGAAAQLAVFWRRPAAS